MDSQEESRTNDTYSTERTSLLNPSLHSESTIDYEGPLPKDDPPIEHNVVPETSSIGRRIGWSSAYILVISRVIGSGIFAMPGVIVQSVGSPGLAMSLWVIGALVALTGLLIDIEYGAMLPRSGGVKVYLEYTYRWPRFLASTLVAVQIIVLGFTASNCIVFAKYVIFATGAEPTDFTTKTLAAGLLTAITIVHGCFYQAGVHVQNVLGWLKIGLAVVMITTGFGVLFTSRDHIPAWDDMWLDSNWEWNTIAAAFLKILYSFAGLENVNNVMNEVKNPVRTIKTVGPAALLTACIMYLLINIAYLSVVPLNEVKQSRELIAALFFEKLGFGRAFLPTAIALSAAGNVMVVVFSLARVKQEIARQGFLPFPQLFASNRPFGSPLGALIIHYVPSLLVILLSPSVSIYAFIAEVEGYAGQFFGLAVAAGLVLLRYKKPDIHRPFKAWLPAVWLRILLAITLILAPWISLMKVSAGFGRSSVIYALVGVLVLMIGIVYWYLLTIVIPYCRGYVLDEANETLSDGTTITKLVGRPAHTS